MKKTTMYNTGNDKKQSIFARMKSKFNAPKAPKADKKAIHERNKKGSKLIISAYPWLLGLALCAALILTGLVGSLLWHAVAVMVKAFAATAAKIFAPMVVAMAIGISAIVTGILWYNQQKKRVMHEAVHGRQTKKSGEFAWIFRHHPIVLGLAFFAGLMALGLAGSLLWQGIGAVVTDFTVVVGKVLAPKVIATVAGICLGFSAIIWYKRQTKKWAKEARRRAAAQAAAKVSK